MKLSLPPLHALRAFEAAARLESFAQAAEELAVTPGAVSRQIAALEAELQVRLFERAHRRVRLTRSGLKLRDEVTASFLRLAEAVEGVRRGGRSAHRLRVSAPPAFSLRWLIPRLPAFQAAHPAVDVGLTTSVAPPDFESGAYDLAVRRYDRAPAGGQHAVALFDELSIPVCHPDLVRGRPLPLDWPALLRMARLVRVAGEPRGWPKWARAWRCDMAAARLLDVELTYLAVQAALEGLGVALLPLALVADDIARGALVAPLGPKRIDASTYFVVAAHAPKRGSAAARMVDWLRREGDASMRAARAMVGLASS